MLIVRVGQNGRDVPLQLPLGPLLAPAAGVVHGLHGLADAVAFDGPPLPADRGVWQAFAQAQQAVVGSGVADDQIRTALVGCIPVAPLGAAATRRLVVPPGFQGLRRRLGGYAVMGGQEVAVGQPGLGVPMVVDGGRRAGVGTAVGFGEQDAHRGRPRAARRGGAGDIHGLAGVAIARGRRWPPTRGLEIGDARHGQGQFADCLGAGQGDLDAQDAAGHGGRPDEAPGAVNRRCAGGSLGFGAALGRWGEKVGSPVGFKALAGIRRTEETHCPALGEVAPQADAQGLGFRRADLERSDEATARCGVPFQPGAEFALVGVRDRLSCPDQRRPTPLPANGRSLRHRQRGSADVQQIHTGVVLPQRPPRRHRGRGLGGEVDGHVRQCCCRARGRAGQQREGGQEQPK